MKILKLSLLLFFLQVQISCKQNVQKQSTKMELKTITEKALQVQNYIKKDIVIAHRGSTYWTPEETEPAYLWARNIGADYLELDVQLTKDNVLIAFHDNVLNRTTNLAKVFPNRTEAAEINKFTLKELRSLDAGSWFNIKNPDRAKQSFINLKIMTLEDVIKIAEGNRIKKENGLPEKKMVHGVWNGNYVYEKDPNDNGNRPGLYIETKHPQQNTELILAKAISIMGWNINANPKTIKTQSNKVAIANTNARIILQSFSPESIINIEKYLPNIPKCFLLWKADMKGDIQEAYTKAIHFAIENNVDIIGSSIAGEPNNYAELTAGWMTKLVHESKMLVHPYTFDTTKQLNEYKNRVDGVFTNRADLALNFHDRESKETPQEILHKLGYN